MRLSTHFTLAEAVKSQTALRRGIDNTPTAAQIRNLRRVACALLEPVRLLYKRPIVPSSWFRAPALNAAIGGAKGSQHMAGQAVDFEVPGVANLEVARFIAAELEFDQLILEFHDPAEPHSGWVHVSRKGRDNRGEILRATRHGTFPGLGL